MMAGRREAGGKLEVEDGEALMRAAGGRTRAAGRWVLIGTCSFVLGCAISSLITALVLSSCWHGNQGIDASRQLQLQRQQLRRLMPNSDNLYRHVDRLSRVSSRAGTDKSKFHADYVADTWRQQGLQVFRKNYEVLLTHLPTSAAISLCHQRQSPCRRLLLDLPLLPEDAIDGAERSLLPFTKELMGDFFPLKVEDLVRAEQKMNGTELSNFLANRVVIADRPLSRVISKETLFMTGGVLRLNADRGGGVPEYPNGTGRPESTISMGSTLQSFGDGDPTTLIFPSLPYAVRTDGPVALTLPNHPTVPVSLADIRQLNSFAENSTSSSFVRVNWPMSTRISSISDVCAHFPGNVEPDRLVVVAGHRDAWHAGALDPHSGVSTLLELSRVFAELRDSGWRPHRSLLLCTWDAEEWNLIGSAEWLDEEIRRADRRIVAYVNTDTDIMGTWKVMVHAFPRMHQLISDIFAEVPNPSGDSDDYHFFLTPDSASDYFVFWRNLGVPTVDLSYIKPNKTQMTLYDLYHTRYDTVHLYNLTDPGGRAHLAILKNYVGIVHNLLDSPILPFDLAAFAGEVEDGMGRVFAHAEKLSEQLGNVTEVWSKLTEAFQSHLSTAAAALRSFEKKRRLLGASLLQQRMLNDKIMEVQKVFAYRSTYPRPAVVNLLPEPGVSALNRVFRHVTRHSKLGNVEIARLRLEKLLETCILSLASIPKILDDSFNT